MTIFENTFHAPAGAPGAIDSPWAAAARANAAWRALCAEHLPHAPAGSIWRYSRPAEAGAPGQGWKIHVAATVRSAVATLRAAAPMLRAANLRFKAPATLCDLAELNAGLAYGYGQVGKFLTVYPATEAEFVRAAARLDRLTKGLDAPVVPFDRRLSAAGNVFYRYGAHTQKDETGRGYLVAPDGARAADALDAEKLPAWVADPFAPRETKAPPAADNPPANPLATRYRVVRALAQRGKGGVYLAFDAQTARPCVIKEGRRHGETGWDGRDGFARVRSEEAALVALAAHETGAPRVYDAFRLANHFYLVLEYIEGVKLSALVESGRLDRAHGAACAAQLAAALARIHAAGWVWRDCKPQNLLLSTRGRVHPLDFEGAARAGESVAAGWRSPEYAPPEAARQSKADPAADLYALGVTIHLLLTGKRPRGTAADAGLTPEIAQLIERLLAAEPARRPPAVRVGEILTGAQASRLQ